MTQKYTYNETNTNFQSVLKKVKQYLYNTSKKREPYIFILITCLYLKGSFNHVL